jgi:phenylpropionate dioxygenase-like ring-hydroxylating dioxygenase large terminal subunit
MMRRLLAASVAAWAVLAVALTLALGHRTATVAQGPTAAPIVLVRQANGRLRALPAQTAHATTQTSGGSGGALPILGQGGQLVSQAPVSHATTSSS